MLLHGPDKWEAAKYDESQPKKSRHGCCLVFHVCLTLPGYFPVRVCFTGISPFNARRIWITLS